MTKTAEKIIQIQTGNSIPEIEELVSEISDLNYDEVIVEDAKVARTIKDKNVIVEFPSMVGRILRSKLLPFIKEFQIWQSEEEIVDYVQQLNKLITRQKIKESSEERDKFVAQAIEAINDCDKSLNVFASRIREWYGLHFPELDKRLPSHTSYIRIVGHLGSREEILKEAFEQEMGFPSDKIEKYRKLARNSMGATLTEFDLKPLTDFALITEKLYKFRDRLADYIDEAMKEIAPNIRALVGALLGARLISLAGSLSRLATMPASTIQVLGAEKALFRALRTGARPPKHGIIFQWEDIHGAPYWLKGKIARIIAGKLSIAARVDHFSGEYMGENLLTDLNRRIEEVKRKYPTAPKRPQKEAPEHTERKKYPKDFRKREHKDKFKKRKKKHKPSKSTQQRKDK